MSVLDFSTPIVRCPENPILTANPDVEWEGGAVFNPGAVKDQNGTIHLLYRAVRTGYRKKNGYGFADYVSVIGHATSKDGIHFNNRKLLIERDKPFDVYSCEDARITWLGGQYLVTYTGLVQPAFTWKGYRPVLATTRDFRSIMKHGNIGPDIENKDVVVFPEYIDGKIAVLQRISPDIQIVYFDSLDQMKENQDERYWNRYLNHLQRHVVLNRKFKWESMKVGAGPPPIKTDIGWLLIYHGVDRKNIYRVGAAILDLENPQKVLFRSPVPLLEPEKNYEREGDIPNVVFPTGAVIIDGCLFLYYGAADKSCCVATCALDDLLSVVTKKYSKIVNLFTGNYLFVKRHIEQRKTLN